LSSVTKKCTFPAKAQSANLLSSGSAIMRFILSAG
jgi:hypothetical protein